MAKKNGKAEGNDETSESKSGGGQAIEAKRTSLFVLAPEAPHIKIVGLDTEHKRNEHPLYDARVFLPVRESLVVSMMENGFLGSIVTAKDGEDLLVVDGKQRVRAAREANIRFEKAGSDRRIMVATAAPMRGEDSSKVGALATLNEHRTIDNIIERARKMAYMMRFENTEKQVAVAFGETEQTVKNYLKVLDCHPDVIKSAERGEVAPSVLVTLSALTRDEQLATFETMRAEGKLTVAEAQKRVYVKKNGKTRTGEEEEGNGKKLPVPVIRKILRLHASSELKAKVSDDTIAVLRLVAGEMEPSRIKGMTEALREVGALE